MKNKVIISLSSLFLSSACVNAAVVSVSNNLGDSSIGITEFDGKPGAAVSTKGFNTTEAFMTFGYFNITDTAIQNSSSASTLYSSLVQLGSNEQNFVASGLFNGIATATMSSPVTITASSFATKNIYVFVANVANSGALVAASEVFVIKLNQTFQASWDSDLTTTAITFGNLDGTVLLGGYNTYQFNTSTFDSSTGPGWNTVTLVPEPSTTLLGAIGALALLRRRRK